MQQPDQHILSQSLHFALTPLFAAFQDVTLFAVVLAECFVSSRILKRNGINTLISRQYWDHRSRSLSSTILGHSYKDLSETMYTHTSMGTVALAQKVRDNMQ